MTAVISASPAQVAGASDIPYIGNETAITGVLAEQLSATLASQDRLADVLFRQGKFKESEALSKNILAQRTTNLAQTHDHPDVLGTMNTLAGNLKTQHRFAEAEDLFRQILESDLRTLGPLNFDTLTSMSSLSEILLLQGKNVSEAEGIARRTVTLSQQLAGLEHPDTALLMDNLANISAGERKFEKAEKTSKEALDLRRKVLRAGHPLIWTSMNNLAAIVGRAGKYKEAEDLTRQALALCQDDAAKLTSVSNLAGVLEKQGRYVEAEILFREAVGLAMVVLGRENGITQSVKRDLASVLTKQGMYKEAEEVLREI